MKKNTMDKKEFIKEEIIWAIMVMIWGSNVLFRCIPGCTLMQTWIIFIAINFVTLIGGSWFSLKWTRNYGSIMQNIVLTWGIFAVLAYRDIFTKKLMILGSITLVITILIILYILVRKIQYSEKRKRIIKGRIYKCFYYLRKNLAVAMVVFMLPIISNLVFNGSVKNADFDMEIPVYGNEYSMLANMDKLVQLQEEQFSELSIEEKLELCKLVCKIEARYLGIYHEINVSTSNLEEGTYGHYNEKKHVVCIDLDCLQYDSAEMVLTTLLHEMYHAYQYCLVESYQKMDEETRNLYMYRFIGIYAEEVENYHSPAGGTEEDYNEYYNQMLEVAAREYSEQEVPKYFARIEDYLRNGVKE